MPLPWRLRLAYAVGHVLNDLCASVWFAYTLVFFKFGIGIPTSLAGTIVLIGQIADGIATPIVGYLSDKYNENGPSSGLSTAQELNTSEQQPTNAQDIVAGNENSNMSGHCSVRCRTWWPSGRKAWHFWGSVLIIFSFPLLFGPIIGGQFSSTWAKMLYYCPLVVIFQIGWASVQISHLSLMNELTPDSSERTLLTSLRYLFTVLSNLAVYLSTFLLFRYIHHKPKNSDTTSPMDPTRSYFFTLRFGYTHMITSAVLSNNSKTNETDSDIDFGINDVPVFQKLALAIIAVGFLFTVLFHLGVRKSDIVTKPRLSETEPVTEGSESGALLHDDTNPTLIRSWRNWFHLPLFWILSFLYMTVRVIVNASQTYITVYLLHTLHLSKNNMSLVPLTIYLTSIVTLLVQKPVQDFISRELNCIIGLVFISIFCTLVNYPGSPPQLIRIYIASGILGIGCTIILITALAMVSDLIGHNKQHGAFVFGYMSFTDKLANGIVIQVIELLWNYCSDDLYYQHVESYGIGCFVIITFICVCTQMAMKRRILMHPVSVTDS